jgi:hypothetical protein
LWRQAVGDEAGRCDVDAARGRACLLDELRHGREEVSAEQVGVQHGAQVLHDLGAVGVLRDRGSLTTTKLLDTLGDDEPGGELLSETLDRISGKRPFLEQDEAAYCAMAHDLIG